MFSHIGSLIRGCGPRTLKDYNFLVEDSTSQPKFRQALYNKSAESVALVLALTFLSAY